jgi:hypothetical protein
MLLTVFDHFVSYQQHIHGCLVQDVRRGTLSSPARLQASGMVLFYIRVNVKALVTGSIKVFKITARIKVFKITARNTFTFTFTLIYFKQAKPT